MTWLHSFTNSDQHVKSELTQTQRCVGEKAPRTLLD